VGNENKTRFAVVLFTGMAVHCLFAEVLNRAPSQILANVTYVQKVIFPLEAPPVITFGAALFHSLVSLAVLLIAYIIFNNHMNWTLIFIPLIFTWMLASLSKCKRDVRQTVGIITTVMMFLSPVFFSDHFHA